MDGQLIYSFISLAATHDTPAGRRTPVEGMKLISALAHKYGIPVTWIVDSQSVQESRDVLEQGHGGYSDDLMLLVDVARIFQESGTIPGSKAEEIVILRESLPEYILSERAKIGELLPWADVNVIAADAKTEILIEILEDLDCIGLWGYNWGQGAGERGDGGEQRDQEGCPWGFFYASREHYDAPAHHAGGLVAVQSTSLDLNAAYHSGNPRVFSANPNSLRMSGLCADEEVNYTRMLLDEYLKNCTWNRFVSFVQQQSAREMEYASYDEYDRGTISQIADILERFLREAASNPGIQVLSMSEAIQFYMREFEYTESCCMAFDSIVPPHIDVNFHAPPEPKEKPPYPFTFLYYDRECQLIFKEDQMTPIEMRNYFRPPFESGYYIEKEMPSISYFRPSRDRDKLIMEFEIETVKQMPFGLAIWDDHSMFSLVTTNVRMVKWIGTYLLFIRMDLEEGLNRVEVSLTI